MMMDEQEVALLLNKIHTLPAHRRLMLAARFGFITGRPMSLIDVAEFTLPQATPDQVRSMENQTLQELALM